MPQTVTLSIKDDKNRVSKVQINFRDLETKANIQAWLDEFLILLEPVIKGGFVSATITSNLTISPARRRVADVTADVEEKLSLSFATVANYKTGVNISTFDDAFTVPLVGTQERIIDFFQEEVTALVNHFTAPSVGGFIQPSDKRSDLIERLAKSRYKFRK